MSKKSRKTLSRIIIGFLSIMIVLAFSPFIFSPPPPPPGRSPAGEEGTLPPVGARALNDESSTPRLFLNEEEMREYYLENQLSSTSTDPTTSTEPADNALDLEYEGQGN